MRYIVKEKLISLKGKYYIRDREDNDVFVVRGNFSLPRKFRVSDAATDKEIIMIKKRMFRLGIIGSFRFYIDGEEVLLAKRKLALKTKYTIEGSAGSFTIDGNILDYDFLIRRDGQIIASIYKKLSLYRDSYVIDIDEGFENYTPIVLGIAVMVDHLQHRGNQQN